MTTRCIHYVTGVSVGVMSQPSAIAVIEQASMRETGRAKIEELRLRHLERLPLSASYPELTKRLRAIQDGLKEQEQSYRPDLLVDITGTGSSVIEFFKNEDLKPQQVWITSGFGQSQVEHEKWRISKKELVGPLLVLMHTDKFKIASGLELVAPLKEELSRFRLDAPPANGADIEAWRIGGSDDLVFATALAVWHAQREIASPKKPVQLPERNYTAYSWMG